MLGLGFHPVRAGSVSPPGGECGSAGAAGACAEPAVDRLAGVRGRSARGEPMEQKSGPEAAPEAEREEGEPEVKKRRLLCVEFASVASCDDAVAQCYLAENDWEMEVRCRCFSLPAGSVGAQVPSLRLCFSESAELLLRAAGGGECLGKPPGDPLWARVLVSDEGAGSQSGRRRVLSACIRHPGACRGVGRPMARRVRSPVRRSGGEGFVLLPLAGEAPRQQG